MKQIRQRMLFVTGTDTGVGKTVLTVRLLRELRASGQKAIALKPFCSGDRDDVRKIWEEIQGERTIEELNPFYSSKPVAPGVAYFAKTRKKSPNIREILSKIKKSSEGYDWVIVEGVGGLLVPLTRHILVRDLIQALRYPVVVVARDQLGTINHSLLTVFELLRLQIPVNALVLMENFEKDFSQSSNQNVISQLIEGLNVVKFPKLGKWPNLATKTKRDETFLKITLANLWRPRIVWPR